MYPTGITGQPATHLATPYFQTYTLKVVITAEKGDMPPLKSPYLSPANQWSHMIRSCMCVVSFGLTHQVINHWTLLVGNGLVNLFEHSSRHLIIECFLSRSSLLVHSSSSEAWSHVSFWPETFWPENTIFFALVGDVSSVGHNNVVKGWIKTATHATFYHVFWPAE